ncbi:MAG: outer membrane beta-barrel protein [Bacteroidota bacterium]
MRSIFIILLTLLPLTLPAQIEFQPGYFITESGNRVECLIKNVDWENNPREIRYRLQANSDIQTARVETITEFGIHEFNKYQRATVQLDTSEEKLDRLSFRSEPEFITEQLLLKVLVDGAATLYYYENQYLHRFFFKIGNSDIQPLVYKKYRFQTGNEVGENISFKNLLWLKLQCEDLTKEMFERMRYSKQSLGKIFQKYNACKGEESDKYGYRNIKDMMNLTIRPGIHYSTFDASNVEQQVGSDTTFRLGVELEVVLPVKKNTWSITVEPTYQSFKTNFTTTTQGTIKAVDYSSIDIPIGLRRYFFLGNSSKIFVNAQLYLMSLAIKKELNYPVRTDVKTNASFGIGAGFTYKERISLEARYGFLRGLARHVVGIHTEYQTFGLILGYNLM